MADGSHVAHLDGITADGGADPAGAPVARLGAPPATADPEAPLAPVADLAAAEADGPGDEGGPAPVGLFDDESVGANRQDVTVVELDPGAVGRRGRGGRPGRRATDRREQDRGAPEGDRTDGDGAVAAREPAGLRPAGRRGGRARRGAPGVGADRRTGRAGRPAPDGLPDQDTDEDADQDPGQDPAHEHRPGGRPRGRRGRGPAELDPDADPVTVARDICLRLLTDRARTRQELAQALRRRGIPDDAAQTVLERFDEVGLVDDAAFAGQWVRSRHTHRGLARRAIAVELRRKGVSDEDAGEALAEVDAESEEQRARQLVDRKLRSLSIGTAEQRAAAARRLVGMLARKGYGAGTAYRVVKEALAERGAEADELGDAEIPED